MLPNEMTSRIWRVIVFAVLVVNAACAPSAAVIKVAPPGSPVHVADTVTVPVEIENVANLTAVEIHLSFNPAVLEVLRITYGDFTKADYVVQNTFDNAAGTIDYAVAQINRPPLNGSGTLIEIVCRAKASGDSAIRFRGTDAAPSGVVLSDSKGTSIKVLPVDGNVNVTGP